LFDVERALITKMVEEGAIPEMVAREVAVDHWRDPECRDIYELVLVHWRMYGSPPSKDVVRMKYRELMQQRYKEGTLRKEDVKDYVFEPAENAFNFYADEFLKLVYKRIGTDRLRNLAIVIEDPSRVMHLTEEFLDAARMMAKLAPGTTMYRFSDMEHRINQYEIAKAEDRPPGIMTGFPTIDSLTHGFQPTQNIVIAAPTKHGKTTLTQAILFNAYLQGKTPMLFPLEMGAEQVYRNWDAMAAKISRRAIKSLSLLDTDVDHWRQVAKRAKEARGERDILVPPKCTNLTPDRVWAEVYRHEPELVAIDYVGLMATPKNLTGYHAVNWNVDQIKHTAVETTIPHILVAQTNREGRSSGVTAETIGESYRISQTCDLMIGLWRDDEMKAENRMKLSVPAHRDGEEHPGVECHWEPDTMTFWELGHDEMLAHSFLNGNTPKPPENIYECA
jgi:replicative DNA helicase